MFSKSVGDDVLLKAAADYKTCGYGERNSTHIFCHTNKPRLVEIKFIFLGEITNKNN